MPVTNWDLWYRDTERMQVVQGYPYGEIFQFKRVPGKYLPPLHLKFLQMCREKYSAPTGLVQPQRSPLALSE